MKAVVVALSGVADVPSRALGGRTPLESARTPALDELARRGRLGAVRLAPRDEHPGSDAAWLALLGYDPVRHPLRRGPLEAVGAGVELGPHDLALRGNFVTLVDERIADLTAGRISSEEARVLLHEIDRAAAEPRLRLVPLLRYRFLVVVKEGADLDVRTCPPHAAFERPVREVYPRGRDSLLFERWLDRARGALKRHEVNRVRLDLGENPANFVWLWGEGTDRTLPSFHDRFGLAGAAVAGAALARGVARRAGLEVIEVPGATGDLDSDPAAKARAAIAALDRFDFVFVHFQGANEASHLRDPRLKREAIERADSHLLAPLVEHLSRRGDDWRLLLACDHPTASESEEALAGRSPFLIAGSGVTGVRGWPFDEDHARRADLQIDEGPALLSYFLGRNPRPH